MSGGGRVAVSISGWGVWMRRSGIGSGGSSLRKRESDTGID